MKKKLFLKKLDLLSISLEILTTWNENKYLIQKFDCLYYDLRSKQYNERYKYILLIEYIYDVIKLIKTYSLDKIATRIIQNKHQFLEQYISKFCYVYYRNKKYYINNKLKLYKANKIHRRAINNIAILNLYIISKLSKTRGIYTLIKYLKRSS